ncbi:acyl-CoA carboxylase epsilon subunit [Actinomadura sediminis]|uniref:Acyl-CoA carboxylase epsilon subunit n=1 Tax=Actinomadura sediminis TaxID=1038904 RepID=A0ABW3EVY1_9ACTN
MTSPTPPAEAAGGTAAGPPLVRIVRGEPDPEHIAALTVVLLKVLRGRADAVPERRAGRAANWRTASPGAAPRHRPSRSWTSAAPPRGAQW